MGFGEGYGCWGRGRLDIPTATDTVTDHQNDLCIRMGSDERNFNVSLIVRDKKQTKNNKKM